MFMMVNQAPIGSALHALVHPGLPLLNPPLQFPGAAGLIWVDLQFGFIAVGVAAAPPQTMFLGAQGLRPRMQFLYLQPNGTILLTEAQDMPVVF